MIERDLKAREGTPRGKITEYFVPTAPAKLAIPDAIADQHTNGSKTSSTTGEEAIAQLADEEIDFEEDFSDIDIDLSLPEMEDLLKGY